MKLKDMVPGRIYTITKGVPPGGGLRVGDSVDLLEDGLTMRVIRAGLLEKEERSQMSNVEVRLFESEYQLFESRKATARIEKILSEDHEYLSCSGGQADVWD